MDHPKRQNHETAIGTSNLKGIKCLYTKVDTITNKKCDLEILIDKHKPDILGITEVKPKNSLWELTEAELYIEGYTLYYNLSGRGSVLYITNNIKSHEIEIERCSEAAVWCDISLRNQDHLLVGVVYRSPNSNEDQNKLLNDMMNSATSLNYSHYLIMGDFNHPEIDWELQSTGLTQDHCSSKFMECVRDTSFINTSLFQLIIEDRNRRQMS